MEENKDKIPAYLKDNSWEKELNHKLWITKGARFEANARLKEKASLSNMSLAFISSYLIIINLMPMFFPLYKIDSNIVNFFTTSLAILLLVYTQIESSNEYKLNAYLFHSCSLKISNLYNDLRITKEIEDEKEKKKKIVEITNEYKEILFSYENHEPIDTEMFKSKNLDYYKLEKKFVKSANSNYYKNVKFKYHFIMIFPPILFMIVHFYDKIVKGLFNI